MEALLSESQAPTKSVRAMVALSSAAGRDNNLAMVYGRKKMPAEGLGAV